MAEVNDAFQSAVGGSAFCDGYTRNMPNRLAAEKSPYLLQHADNPVDWYPWGDEAFGRARLEDKPIFLSIGYSTCHWCHVMEHESFENHEVAAVLNREFVAIKVDREERPDVDRVYMAFVQATTGSGGWPMSVWLTPALQPFYGGTYFPPASRWQRPGFVDVLLEIARAWKTERTRVVESAASLTERLQGAERRAVAGDVPPASALDRTRAQFRASYDARRGGFGGAPKFPRPSELLFLLREHARTGDIEARDAALHTLRAMALGGMRDHIGGRLPPLLGGCGVARAALREDALRPGAARARISRGRAGHERSVLRRDCRRHAGVRGARDDRRPRRLLLRGGCRQPPAGVGGRPRGAQGRRRVLRVDGRRDPRLARRRCAGVRGAVRAARGRQRARGSAGGVRRQESAVHREIDSRRSLARRAAASRR